MDAWSFAVALEELGAFYRAEQRGRIAELPALPWAYADYVGWQAETLASPEGQRLADYWQEQLAGCPPTLDLPTDRLRPPVQSYRGALCPLDVGQNLSERLRDLARAERATPYMTLLAAFQVLFQVAFDWYTPTRSVEREISLLGTPASSEAAGEETPLVVQRGAPFDLMLMMVNFGRRLSGSLQYNTDLFEPATIARMAGHYRQLLEGIVADPDRRLDDFSLLSACQRRQVLVEWNATQAPYPATVRVDEVVAAQARRTPDAIACAQWHDKVARPERSEGRGSLAPPRPSFLRACHPMGGVSPAETLSYRELDRRANCLARRLQALGVGPGRLVGLCVDRSVDMLVAILGTLKAGGAYVPLDPTFPPRAAGVHGPRRRPGDRRDGRLVPRRARRPAQRRRRVVV